MNCYEKVDGPHEDDEEVQKLNFTKQIEKLNEHPINQRAKEIFGGIGTDILRGEPSVAGQNHREYEGDGCRLRYITLVGIRRNYTSGVDRKHTVRSIWKRSLRTLWTPKTEAGWKKLYDTLPMMSELEMSYRLIWLAEPLWQPDQQPKEVLDRLCGKHLPTCQELERTRENFHKLYGDNAVQLSQGSLSADIVIFLTEPDPKTAINKLKELLRMAATGIYGYV